MDNQDWALANWRAWVAESDPPYLSTAERHGKKHVWISIGGNVGWYFLDGDAVFSEAYTEVTKLVSPKQLQKIKHALQ